LWERYEIEHERAINDDFVALDFDADLSHGPAPFRDLIIEGDNFDALRVLRMSYAGKVKCIYIDPPYNTGNRDFIYNDRFVDREDSYRHSKWLEFMYRRLLLARELLAEDGVIFVSIDDNEVFHLGLLMSQIFGAANFIANVIWQKVFSPKGTAQHFSDDHEYIVCYALNRAIWRPNPMPRTLAQNKAYKNPDRDPRGPWTSGDLSARNFYSKGTYAITCPSGRVVAGPPPGNYWRFAEEKFLELDRDKRIWWGKNGDNIPRLKRFLSDVQQGVVPQTLWKYEEVGHTQDAKHEIHDILRFENTADVFSTPKPIRLIERILRIATNPGDLVLDFFAGSGTTAQAVLKLNAEDGGDRRFILVSSTEATADAPDKNLCRDVCAERVRRVMSGYRNRKGEEVAGLGGAFGYLHTRRIAANALLTIDHAPVWNALQLMHIGHLTPYRSDEPLQRADSDAGLLLYLPRVSETAIAALHQCLDAAPRLTTVYSWQAALLRQRIADERATFEQIPQCLAARFGLGGAA
jgi:adenine-specific DNA-methyltransferase